MSDDPIADFLAREDGALDDDFGAVQVPQQPAADPVPQQGNFIISSI